MAAPTEAELCAFLKEHLAYEAQMLAWTRSELERLDAGPLYYAVFESYCLHARNWYLFLRNDGKANAFKARDYLGKRPFKMTADPKAQAPLGEPMNEQLFHLSIQRLRKADTKMERKVIELTYPWLVENIKRFIEALPEGYKRIWERKARSSPTTVGTVMVRGDKPSATNVMQSISFTTTILDARPGQVSYEMTTGTLK